MRDKGNDTTTDTSTAEGNLNVVDLLTPNSKSTINITSPDGESEIDLNEKDSEKQIVNGREVEKDGTMKEGEEYNGDDEKTRSITKHCSEATLNQTEFTEGCKSSNNERNDEESSDSERTVDLDGEEEKSEIGDVSSSTSDMHSKITEDENDNVMKKSEITKPQFKVHKRRPGSTRPVVKLKQMKDVYESNKETEPKEKYREFAIVKLGCQKCTGIYYSEGALNKHLIDKHRIRNTGCHPPIVINKIWSKIPEKPPLLDGQKECKVCQARFFDADNFHRHESKCCKRTVEEEEDNQCSLYKLIERQEQEEKEEKEKNKKKKRILEDEDNEVIAPTQITKKKRRSQSKKRNWTMSKKRT